MKPFWGVSYNHVTAIGGLVYGNHGSLLLNFTVVVQALHRGHKKSQPITHNPTSLHGPPAQGTCLWTLAPPSPQVLTVPAQGWLSPPVYSTHSEAQTARKATTWSPGNPLQEQGSLTLSNIPSTPCDLLFLVSLTSFKSGDTKGFWYKDSSVNKSHLPSKNGLYWNVHLHPIYVHIL